MKPKRNKVQKGISLIDRFYTYVDRTGYGPNNECHKWIGGKLFYYDKAYHRPKRIAWRLNHDMQELPESVGVFSTCGSNDCVNPAHLVAQPKRTFNDSPFKHFGIQHRVLLPNYEERANIISEYQKLSLENGMSYAIMKKLDTQAGVIHYEARGWSAEAEASPLFERAIHPEEPPTPTE